MANADENLKAEDQRIDPRLDNRTGKDRPPLETFPAKPQQIDGPSLMDEIPRPEEANQIDPVVRKGVSSPGPHGLGDTEAVPFEVAVENPEMAVTADEKGKVASETAKTGGDSQENKSVSEQTTNKTSAPVKKDTK